MGDMLLAIFISLLVVVSCEIKSQRELDLEKKLGHCLERPDSGDMP